MKEAERERERNESPDSRNQTVGRRGARASVFFLLLASFLPRRLAFPPLLHPEVSDAAGRADACRPEQGNTGNTAYRKTVSCPFSPSSPCLLEPSSSPLFPSHATPPQTLQSSLACQTKGGGGRDERRRDGERNLQRRVDLSWIYSTLL